MGRATGPKNDKNTTTTVDFYLFLDYHCKQNLLICLFLVYFSQEDSPAYLHPFEGTMEGLWGPMEVIKWSKMVQNCIFWSKSTLYPKTTLSILSLLRHHEGPTLGQVIQH